MLFNFTINMINTCLGLAMVMGCMPLTVPRLHIFEIC